MSDNVEIDYTSASIRNIRRSLGLSQQELAMNIGIAQGSLSRLERGIGANHLEIQVREFLRKSSKLVKTKQKYLHTTKEKSVKAATLP
jgi:transcriptional regulator with XRE-family HTH domain